MTVEGQDSFNFMPPWQQVGQGVTAISASKLTKVSAKILVHLVYIQHPMSAWPQFLTLLNLLLGVVLFRICWCYKYPVYNKIVINGIFQNMSMYLMIWVDTIIYYDRRKLKVNLNFTEEEYSLAEDTSARATVSLSETEKQDFWTKRHHPGSWP